MAGAVRGAVWPQGGRPTRSAPAHIERTHPTPRESDGPMAERVAPGDYDRLHQFVSDSVWGEAPLE